MHVFLTGGSGYLGHYLIPALLHAGHHVNVLCRSSDSSRLVLALGGNPVEGSLSDIAAWTPQLLQADAVIHAAAPPHHQGSWPQLEQDIVTASLALYRAANHAGVPHFIFISSDAALLGEQALLDIDETSPYPALPCSPYGQAKKMAELRLLQSSCQTRLSILRPGTIWGEDSPLLQRLERRLQQHRFFWINHGNIPVECIHVDNLVAAILLLLQHPADDTYLVSDGEPRQLHEFLSAVIRAMGYRPPRLSLPLPAARSLLKVDRFLCRHFDRDTPLLASEADLAFMSLPRRYDISHIRDTLHYRPVTSTAEGLARLTPH